jgi:glycosyltransferase involved in cell wall biosynthesis
MHLTALVESLNHVCCRYRLAAFRPFLEAAGHSLELRALPRGWWARMRCFRQLRDTVVVLQRRLLPGWQLSYLRHNVRRLIFDFDDAIFLRDSYATRGMHDGRRMRRFAAAVRASDAVLAGNHFLRARALTFTDRPCVHLMPTCVDPGRYPLGEQDQGRGSTFVWVGSSSTLQGLGRCAPLLEEVGARLPGLRLKLICDQTLSLRHLTVEFSSWSEENEGTLIAAADVGISWVPDDEWSRGKCGLKVLQYMAAGLPVIANPVGVHREMVRHDETGFLAETPDEWVAAAQRLMADPALRTRMGRAGRRLVEERYGLACGARRWLGVLDEIRPASARTA